MRKRLYRLALLILICGTWHNAVSQEISLFFDRLTIRDGLSQSMINTIIQDKQGFMWFGTQAGLNRYDGYTFRIFRKQDNVSSLSANFIVSLAETDDRTLWIATSSSGISMYNPQTGRFRNLISGKHIPSSPINTIIADGSSNHVWVASNGSGVYRLNRQGHVIFHFRHKDEDNSSISSNRVGTLFEDEKGYIWVGTLDAGLNRINPATNEVVRYDFITCADGVPLTHVSSICEDDKGSMWIGTNNRGIAIYNPLKGTTTHLSYDREDKKGLPSNAVNTILRDSNNRIWVGTARGLALYSASFNGFHSYFHQPKTDNSLSDDNIISLYEDRSGILWIGTTNGGVNKLARSYTVFHNLRNDPENRNSLSSDIVWSFYEDNDNTLWIGTSRGLNKYNPATRSYKHYNLAPGSMVEQNTVRTIAPHPDGTLYVGTDGGGVAIVNPVTETIRHITHRGNTNNSLAHNKVRDFLINNDGSMYIATMDGLNWYNPASGQFKTYRHNDEDSTTICDNRILEVMRDRLGRIWLATYNGLALFNPLNETFSNYYHNPNDTTSLTMNLVIDIHESPSDPPGILWVGTASGLNRFDSKNGKSERFYIDFSMDNNLIYTIVEDNRGFLWFGTNHGLVRMDRKTASFKNFGHKDGIENEEYNAGAAVRLRNGKLYFGGLSGVTAFNPTEIPENREIPPIAITSFRIYDKEISIDSILANNSTLSLLADDKFIAFEFAALDYTNPLKNEYRYKMEGFDKSWNDAGNRRYASYTNLDPGYYTFRVLGSNNDDVWNEEGVSLSIYIKPPFWKTLWFRLFGAFALIFASLSFYRSRVERIKRHREELRHKVNERTKELYKRNIDLKRAKKETDQILANVEEGFFLLDKDMTIQSQHSLALLKILEQSKLAGLHFLDLLDGYLNEDISGQAREFIGFMFDERLDEELIGALNPLEKCAFAFKKNRDEYQEEKFLTFTFRRVYENSHISGLIVTLTDVTKELKLSHKLAETEARVKKHMDWAVSVLQTPPLLLKEFLSSSFAEIESITGMTKDADVLCAGNDEPDFIGRALHLIKGNANLLELNFISKQVHSAEEIVSELRQSTQPKPRQTEKLAAAIANLRGDLFELKRLIDRLSEFGNQKKNQTAEDGTVSAVSELAARMGRELKKNVAVDASGYQQKLIPPSYTLLVKNILVQLVRNSMCHGLESKEERQRLSKPEQGTIYLASRIDDGKLIIDFRDDGRGLQIDKLRDKALRSERWSADELKDWSREKLAELIFVPGISSTKEVTEYAGRGIGMDLIREQLKKHEGEISVTFEKGQYCAFRIVLPLFSNN